MTRTNPRSPFLLTLAYAAALLVAPMGVLWHELAGHGLVGVLCGGHLDRLQVLGLQLLPRFEWTGLGEGLGACDVGGIPTRWGRDLSQLAGAGSTLIAAAAALLLLRWLRPRGPARVALICIGLWSLDIVTYTFPSLSIRRYIWFGTTYSEPYEAAVSLGIPGPLFQVAAIVTGLLVFSGLLLPLRREGARARAFWLRPTLVFVTTTALMASGWYWRSSGSVPQQTFPPVNWALDPSTRVRDWQDDIDTLARELPRLHANAFFKCPRDSFLQAAATLRADATHLSDDEIVVGLMRLAGMIGDLHTGIGVGSLQPGFHSLPISLYLFSDGLVITAARENQKDLIGCTLLKLGDTPADEALQRVMCVSGQENEATFKDFAPRLLTSIEIVHALGLIPTRARAPITVRGPSGSERTLDLTPMAPGDRWATPDFDPARLPLSRQKHPHRNWFEPVGGEGGEGGGGGAHKAIYFRYATCADEPDQTVSALTDQLLAVIDAGGIDRLIIDLRANGGGNSGLLDPLIRQLAARPAVHHPGGLIALIGRATYSSAEMNAESLKSRLGATLIGEPTGQKPNAFGEVRTFILPHSHIQVRYSTRFFHTAPADPPSLNPDLPVPTSSADYFALRDPPLEAALHDPPPRNPPSP